MLAGVVLLGGLARGLPTPPIIHKDVADALWAMAIYLTVRLIFPSGGLARSAIAATAIAFGIEFLKLCHFEWLERFRSTWIGGLSIGRYFHAMDLLRCAAGIVAGVMVDRWLPGTMAKALFSCLP